MTFDFNKQLAIGNNGEELFKNLYYKLGPVKAIDKEIDFILADGSKIELKTDTYDMSRTPNFFMESLGNDKDMKIGGPWRALEDKIDFFVYLFIRNQTFYWFNTKTLCQTLDDMIIKNKFSEKTIKNKGWLTKGYIVPRISLDFIIHKKDIF